MPSSSSKVAKRFSAAGRAASRITLLPQDAMRLRLAQRTSDGCDSTKRLALNAQPTSRAELSAGCGISGNGDGSAKLGHHARHQSAKLLGLRCACLHLILRVLALKRQHRLNILCLGNLAG